MLVSTNKPELSKDEVLQIMEPAASSSEKLLHDLTHERDAIVEITLKRDKGIKRLEQISQNPFIKQALEARKLLVNPDSIVLEDFKKRLEELEGVAKLHAEAVGYLNDESLDIIFKTFVINLDKIQCIISNEPNSNLLPDDQPVGRHKKYNEYYKPMGAINMMVGLVGKLEKLTPYESLSGLNDFITLDKLGLLKIGDLRKLIEENREYSGSTLFSAIYKSNGYKGADQPRMHAKLLKTFNETAIPDEMLSSERKESLLNFYILTRIFWESEDETEVKDAFKEIVRLKTGEELK